jgi:hypothetical protein
VRQPADRASCALGPSLPRRPNRHGGRRPIGLSVLRVAVPVRQRTSDVRPAWSRGPFWSSDDEARAARDDGRREAPAARTPLRVSFTRASTIQCVGIVRTTDD